MVERRDEENDRINRQSASPGESLQKLQAGKIHWFPVNADLQALGSIINAFPKLVFLIAGISRTWFGPSRSRLAVPEGPTVAD